MKIGWVLIPVLAYCDVLVSPFSLGADLKIRWVISPAIVYKLYILVLLFCLRRFEDKQWLGGC